MTHSGSAHPSVPPDRRVAYLDLARGLAVFFMIMQHAVIIHAIEGGESGVLGAVLLLLGTAPAAPVFMVVMGVFIMRARSGAGGLAKRGLVLFLLGYLLNLLRFTAPLSLAGTLGAELPPEHAAGYLFWEVDILQLAGLSMLATAALRPLAANSFALPGLILAVLFVSPFLWERFGEVSLLAPVCGTSSIVSFPFFPWVAYPLLGMYMSGRLYRLDGSVRDRWFLAGAGFGFVLLGVLTAEALGMGDYHRSGAGVHFGIIGFVFLWLVLCRWTVARTNTKGAVFRAIAFWSRYVTGIYFVQWILFGWSILFLGANAMSDYGAAAMGLVVLALSHGIMTVGWVRAIFSRI